jgi:hypothetical protein
LGPRTATRYSPRPKHHITSETDHQAALRGTVGDSESSPVLDTEELS